MRYVEINARELLWSKEALDFYNYLAEKVVDHPAGKKYLETYFKNKILHDELTLPLATESEYKKAHIKNKYTEKALDNNELYLVKFDDHHKRLFTELFDYIRTLDINKPINIPFKEIPKVVQKYHEQFQNLKEEREDLDNIETIYTFKDGYKWVSINSQQGLKREGSRMQHCVASYWRKIQNGIIKILSLRDKQNKPHITVEYEIKTKRIIQVQGKQDLPPIQKYIPYLEFLLLSKKFPLKNTEKFVDSYNYYGMQYQDNHFYSPYDLPDNFTWCGNLNLSNTNITKLPENLHVIGSLDLRNTLIKELPEGLHIRYDLNLSNTKITELPEGLHVGSYLDLYNTPITKLPKDLHLGGALDLQDTNITELPENLHLGDDLNLKNTPLTELPKGLQVGGNLNVSCTRIKELPKDLHVDGNLNVSGTKIKELPKDLHISGNLNLSFTKITELPKGLQVNGYLDLSNTKIKELPKGLRVGDHLWLNNTPIKELPEGLHVGNDLYLRNTSITKLPKGLYVGKDLLVDTKELVNKLSNDLSKDLHIGGKIYT